jgi:hypothetical protein
MDLGMLGQMLVAIGCPPEKSAEMAAQLDKRAQQLSTERAQSYDEAMTYLIGLLKQGWAAKERGFS